MAVFTKLSDAELGELLSCYDIAEFKEARGIAEGVENSNYLIITETDRYILTIFEKRANKSELPFFVDLKKHLAKQNIPCPLPIADKNGGYIQNIKNKPALLISFLKGKSVKFPSTDQCNQLGAMIGQMHNKSDNFKTAKPNEFGIKFCESVFNELDKHQDIKSINYWDEVKSSYHKLQEEWDETLPRTIIHGDLFPDNVFFNGDKLSGVIDFYFACHEISAYDIAIAMNAWVFEHGTAFNITKAKQLLRGYNDVRELGTKERDALPNLCAVAALRFLLTRLQDMLNPVMGATVNQKDPKEYLEKLRFHLQVRSVGEYGLN